MLVTNQDGLAAAEGGAGRLVAAWLSGKSRATIASYSADLQDFAAFVGAADVNEAARRLLGRGYAEANSLAFDYRAHLLERKVAPATVNRHLASLKSLTKVARMLGAIPWVLEVPSLRSQSYRDTRGPGRDGFLSLMAKLRERKDPKGLRDSALLRLMYERGLRVGEALGLDVADVDWTRSRLFVVGKGRSQKEPITIAATTLMAVRLWVEARGDEPGALFTRFRGPKHGNGRLTRQGAYAVVRQLGESVGVRARPHGLRHSAITAALDAGLDVRSVQRFSRHKSLQTVITYDDNRRDLGGDVARAIAEPEPEAA
jgi:integrase/recombinase XerC